MKFSRRHFLATGAALAAPRAANAQPAPHFRTLEARKGRLRLEASRALETDVWTFDGQAPGPVLRYRKGDEIRIRFVNRLDEPCALHWGGMRIDNAMDGVPDLTQKPVQPGQSFDYQFTAPDAGLYWYHASGPNMAEQVARGLAGLLIVEETEPPAVHREIISVITDWRLDPKGQLATCAIGGKTSFSSSSDFMSAGRIGDMLMVNAQMTPEKVDIEPGSRVRLRLANFSTARIMAVTFEGLLPMVIGIDGQACGAFEPVRRTIPVGPGSRFDVMFDLPNASGVRAAVRMTGMDQLGGGPDRDLVVFDIRGKSRPSLGPIVGPEQNPLLPPIIRLDRATRLDLSIEGGFANDAEMKRQPVCMAAGGAVWKINGRTGKALNDKPLFSVARGTAVSLGFINKSRVAQVIRLHGHVMRQLHLLDDGWEPYWRDSVIVPPGKTVRVAFVADNPGKWRLGSGILEHAVSGLSAWFEVKA